VGGGGGRGDSGGVMVVKGGMLQSGIGLLEHLRKFCVHLHPDINVLYMRYIACAKN